MTAVLRGLTGLACAFSSWLLAPLRALTGLVCAFVPRKSPELAPRAYRCGDLVTFVHAVFKQKFNGIIVDSSPSGARWFVDYEWPDGTRATTICHPREFVA